MVSIVFYYHKLNRYSFNALAGALDGDPETTEAEIVPAKSAEEIGKTAGDLLHRNEKIILAFSLLTSQFRDMARLIRQLRNEYGSSLIILAGGAHVTADPEGAVRMGVDAAFRGEAEAVFPMMIKRLARGEDFRDLPGIAFREGDKVVINSRPQPVDIDAFVSFSPKRGMFGPIEITRGCPFACRFCQTSSIFGTRPRHRNIHHIVRQAAALRSKKRNVRLLSPNAFSYGSPDGRQLNLAAIRELLLALRQTLDPGDLITFGHFPSEVRPEHVTSDTLELLREFADNEEIVIGAQSGSQRMLDACHRCHDVASVLTAVSVARKFGYRVIVDFILGLPGETSQDVRETVRVIEEIARQGARIHPHAFVPLPQTAFSEERPGKISPEVIRVLEQLKPQRAIYGDWVPQRRLANRIYRELQ